MKSNGWILALPMVAALACGEPVDLPDSAPTELAAHAVAQSEPAPDRPPNAGADKRRVILILLDAARLDRFGYMGYARATTPVMDALAERGAVFLNHYAHATHTRESLPNLFYSRYFFPNLFPSSSAVPFDTPGNLFRQPDDESISLPKALEAAGFATVAISTHSWIKPGTRIAGEFEELQDLAGELRHYSPPARIAIDRAVE